MYKLNFLLSALMVSLLGGCATQGYQNAGGSQYPAPYQTQYPANYPNSQQGQYPNQYPNQYQNQYPDQYQNSGQYQNQPQNNVYTDNAVIIGIREIQQAGNGGQSGAGAIVGAILGGVAGHQVGKGSGRDLATVGGVIAGGLVGNEMEKSSAPRIRNELTIRMPNGETRSLLVDHGAPYRVGDRIRVGVQNGQMVIVQ